MIQNLIEIAIVMCKLIYVSGKDDALFNVSAVPETEIQIACSVQTSLAQRWFT
jgi:hypothetical protein